MNKIENFNRFFDHTILKADAKEEEILKLIAEAKEHNFASICVQPFYVALGARELTGTEAKVCTVIDFPFGCASLKLKVREAKEAVINGAQELDMVINVAALKNRDYLKVLEEIKGVKEVAGHRVLKVIIESSLLSDAEIEKASELVLEANGDFVKTSTGFAKGGASTNAIKIIKKVVGNKAQIKASGGVRELAFTRELIEAGATRIGSSSAIKILEEYNNALNV